MVGEERLAQIHLKVENFLRGRQTGQVAEVLFHRCFPCRSHLRGHRGIHLGAFVLRPFVESQQLDQQLVLLLQVVRRRVCASALFCSGCDARDEILSAPNDNAIRTHLSRSKC